MVISQGITTPHTEYTIPRVGGFNQGLSMNQENVSRSARKP